MEQGLKQWLDTFNTAADRTQLSPADHRNFQEVIRTADKSDPTFTSHKLKEWLTAKGWPADVIEKLGNRYIWGRVLLNKGYTDRSR